MSKIATATYAVPGSADAGAPVQLSELDVEKLQEIHELINLLMRELPTVAQAASAVSRPLGVATMPAVVPYSYSIFQSPWGGAPFAPR